LKKNQFDDAIDLINKSLSRNTNHHLARHLKAVLFRIGGNFSFALNEIEEGISLDHFSFGMHFEKYLVTQDPADKSYLINLMQDRVHNFLECALDYAHMGRYEEAIEVLEIYLEGKKEVYPMVHYFKGYFLTQLGQKEKALENLKLAEQMPMDFCFPNRLEEVIILQMAILSNPEGSRANYYLGNFWYAFKQYELAKKAWKDSINLDQKNAYCHRNLALLYFNKENEENLARIHLEEAFNHDSSSSRLLMELDQFYKKTNTSLQKRYSFLKEHLNLVKERDDIYLEFVSLLNLQGRHEEGLDMVMDRTFHPWEGGEGKVVFQYLTSLIELSKLCLKNGLYSEAIQYLQKAKNYPNNLGEGKLPGTQENDLDYWLGCAYQKMGMHEKANEYWLSASTGPDYPSPAIFYNDQQPDKIFYKGLAMRKLGKEGVAEKIFHNLVEYGEEHLNDEVKLDYFAISLPDLLIWEEDLNTTNKRLCTFLMGLGYLGLGIYDKATGFFQEVLESDGYHIPAKLHLDLVGYLKDSKFNDIKVND